jgi:hypothetical protein
MRAAIVLGVLCVAGAPALAGPATYVYQVTSGTCTLDVEPNGLVSPDPVVIPGGGTFAVTIDDASDGVGESDTFVLSSASLYNSEQVVVDVNLYGFTGTLTAPAGNLYISAFSSVTAGHIGSEGSGTTQTDVYGGGSWYAVLPGVYTGWISDETWSKNTEAWTVSFGIVDGVPETVTVQGAFTYEYTLPLLGDQPTMGQGMEFQAVLIPEPTTCGLLTLGLATLAARRRRRSRRC